MIQEKCYFFEKSELNCIINERHLGQIIAVLINNYFILKNDQTLKLAKSLQFETKNGYDFSYIFDPLTFYDLHITLLNVFLDIYKLLYYKIGIKQIKDPVPQKLGIPEDSIHFWSLWPHFFGLSFWELRKKWNLEGKKGLSQPFSFFLCIFFLAAF